MNIHALFAPGISTSCRSKQVSLRNSPARWASPQYASYPGEGLYIGIDPFNKDETGKPVKMVKSKGVKQRVHPTKVVDGIVWVKDSGADEDAAGAATAGTTSGSSEEKKYAIASDQYACEGFARSARDGIHSSSKDFR